MNTIMENQNLNDEIIETDEDAPEESHKVI